MSRSTKRPKGVLLIKKSDHRKKVNDGGSDDDSSAGYPLTLPLYEFIYPDEVWDIYERCVEVKVLKQEQLESLPICKQAEYISSRCDRNTIFSTFTREFVHKIEDPCSLLLRAVAARAGLIDDLKITKLLINILFFENKTLPVRFLDHYKHDSDIVTFHHYKHDSDTVTFHRDQGAWVLCVRAILHGNPWIFEILVDRGLDLESNGLYYFIEITCKRELSPDHKHRRSQCVMFFADTTDEKQSKKVHEFYTLIGQLYLFNKQTKATSKFINTTLRHEASSYLSTVVYPVMMYVLLPMICNQRGNSASIRSRIKA